MSNFKRMLPLAAVAALACAGAAHATTILDASMYGAIAGTASYTSGSTTFTAAGDPGAVFIQKSVNGSSGLGITGGRTNDEIDIGELATVTFASAVVSDFTVSLLYNGPEFGDVHEVAQVTAFSGGTAVGTYTLTVGPDGSLPGAAWTGSGTVLNLSLPTASGGGSWEVFGNPFGNAAIDKLEFTALTGVCTPDASCDNQSDYVLTSINAVPEPGAYALMIAGLGVVGFMARRQRRQA